MENALQFHLQSCLPSNRTYLLAAIQTHTSQSSPSIRVQSYPLPSSFPPPLPHLLPSVFFSPIKAAAAVQENIHSCSSINNFARSPVSDGLFPAYLPVPFPVSLDTMMR